MKSTRRHFIKIATIGGIGLSFPLEKNTKIKHESAAINKPIVLSTWNFGVQANAAAW